MLLFSGQPLNVNLIHHWGANVGNVVHLGGFNTVAKKSKCLKVLFCGNKTKCRSAKHQKQTQTQKYIFKKSLKRPKNKAGRDVQSGAWHRTGRVPSGGLFSDVLGMNWQVCCGLFVLAVQKAMEVEDVWKPPSSRSRNRSGR